MAKVAKMIRVSESTYEELCETAELTAMQKSHLMDLAWRTFKNSRDYSKLVLFGRKNEEN